MFCWTLHLSGGTERNRPAAVAVGNEVYCFGGCCDGNRDQIGVNVFNTVSLRWTKLPPVTTEGDERRLDVPTERAGHTAVLIEDTIYIWGGNTYDTRRDQIDYFTYCNVLYAFDVDTHRWFKASGTVPEMRNHSACVLGKVMFIYGLSTYYQQVMYKLDTTTMVWTLIKTRGNGPYTSSKNASTIIGTKMFVCMCKEVYRQYFNKVHVFDTETNHWLKIPVNSAGMNRSEHRFGHSPFTYNGELYIFKSETRYMASYLWKFSPETFSWKKVELKGKGPSSISTMCCCMVGDRFILFNNDDLFVFDLSPSLKTLCKLAVIQYRLDHSDLPHNIRWELAAMTTNSNNN